MARVSDLNERMRRVAEGRKRARNTYSCLRYEHRISAGTDYLTEIVDTFNEPFASFRAVMKIHPQTQDGCDCEECPGAA